MSTGRPLTQVYTEFDIIDEPPKVEFVGRGRAPGSDPFDEVLREMKQGQWVLHSKGSESSAKTRQGRAGRAGKRVGGKFQARRTLNHEVWVYCIEPAS